MNLLTKSLPFSTPVVFGALGAALLLYIVLVQRFRWERYNAIHRQYEERWKKGNLTVAEAQQIMHVSAVYDMPWLIVKALSFALFKTYAVVSAARFRFQRHKVFNDKLLDSRLCRSYCYKRVNWGHRRRLQSVIRT